MSSTDPMSVLRESDDKLQVACADVWAGYAYLKRKEQEISGAAGRSGAHGFFY